MEKKLSSREIRESYYWMKIILRGSAALCVVFGFACAFAFYNNIPKGDIRGGVKQQPAVPFHKDLYEDYFQRNSNIGSFIGGVAGAIFSLAGVFLLYLNLRIQDENSERDKVEGRFFELTRLQRDNISELTFRHGRTGEAISTGRRVFKEIYEQILEASDIADKILVVYPPAEILKSSTAQHIPPELVYQFAKISLSYNIVLYGVAKKNDNSTFNALQIDFKEEFIRKAIKIYGFVPALYEKAERKSWVKIKKGGLVEQFIKMNVKEKQSRENDALTESEIDQSTDLMNCYKCLEDRSGKFYKRFGGHQHKIGHYFRHLFQTVRYIDKQDILSYKEKYEYVKTLRAQLSNYEQYVLFYNSLSFVGREWEFNHRHSVRREKFLISKYNMIKNIPDIRANQIQINSFYPLVDFEFEIPSALRKAVVDECWDSY
jgi:hypothetical protein